MENPQAFTSKSIELKDSALQAGRIQIETHHLGMTLLDYFSGQALAGIMANIEYLKAIQNPKPQETIAFNCFELAQSMLKQRELIMKGE